MIPHVSGGELWNESYYNDFGSPDGSLGVSILDPCKEPQSDATPFDNLVLQCAPSNCFSPILEEGRADETSAVRVGQQANLNRSMIYGALVRPNKVSAGQYVHVHIAHSALCQPSIMILDENAPLAVNKPFRQTVTTPKVQYEHYISEPLKTMTIKMTAIGRVYEDPASILTGGTGDGDETVVVNLTWKTQGALHKWRLTPRCACFSALSEALLILAGNR